MTHFNPANQEEASGNSIFFYKGADIRLGDVIRTPHATGIVKELIAPGGDWAGQNWPDGYIVIEEIHEEGSSSIGFEPYTVGWEDMALIHRSPSANDAGM